MSVGDPPDWLFQDDGEPPSDPFEPPKPGEPLKPVPVGAKPPLPPAERFAAEVETLAKPWRGELPPPKQWACEYLAIGPGRPSLLVAPPGHGKGWTALALALSVASGRSFGELTQGGDPQPVVWLDYEEGDYELQRRQAYYCTGCGIAPSDVEGFRSYSFPPQLSEPSMQRWLIERLKGVRLCVIDTLTVAWAIEDRKSSNAAAPLETLTRISSATGCSILLVYHTRKLNKENAGALEQEKVLGSQSIIGAASCIWMGSSQGEGQLLYTHAKVNGARRSDPFQFSWSWQREGGGIAYSAKSVPAMQAPSLDALEEMKTKRARENLERCRAAIIAHMATQPGGVTRNAIRSAMAGKPVGGSQAVWDCVSLLIDEGAIVGPKGGRPQTRDLLFLADVALYELSGLT